MIDRELGESIGVSIATAQPLEVLMKVDKPLVYSHFFLNVKTLYRNLIGSFKVGMEPNETVCLQLLSEEINTISGIIANSLPGHLSPVFYITTSKTLERQLPKANFRYPKTPLQKAYFSKEERVLGNLLNADKSILIYDVKIDGKMTNSLILTHLPIDLLSYTTFKQLTLIESHTGVLKLRNEWVTKLTKREDCRNIPFNIMTIQILGDNNNLLFGFGKKVIDDLINLAKESRWSSITTTDKLIFDINKLKDKYLAIVLKDMLKDKIK